MAYENADFEVMKLLKFELSRINNIIKCRGLFCYMKGRNLTSTITEGIDELWNFSI